MEDRWQPERTNGSSEGFVFSVQGENTAGELLLAIKWGLLIPAAPPARCVGTIPGTAEEEGAWGIFFFFLSFCGDELMPAPLGVSPDKAGSRVISQPAAPPLSPLFFLPFQPPCPWPRSQRPCVKRLVTCGKGNCLLCAGSPASGLLFTCYLVLPPLRYPWKTRPGERPASAAELV